MEIDWGETLMCVVWYAVMGALFTHIYFKVFTEQKKEGYWPMFLLWPLFVAYIFWLKLEGWIKS